jgi:hypothetical protein
MPCKAQGFFEKRFKHFFLPGNLCRVSISSKPQALITTTSALAMGFQAIISSIAPRQCRERQMGRCRSTEIFAACRLYN